MAMDKEKGGIVRVRIPATSANIGPGFDAMGIALTLYNELDLELRPEKKLDIAATGEGAAEISADENNLVWQAIHLLLTKVEDGGKYKGAKIRMENRVPLSRGLGSSAAAIVGGLAAANAWLGSPLGKNEILDLATKMEGHPDNVAPAIYGGFAVSVTRGETIDCLTFFPDMKLKLIVAVPDFFLPTQLARSVLPETVPRADAVFNVGRASLLAAAMARGQTGHLKAALFDRLHQPYRENLVPGFGEVTKAACLAGAIGCVLSGAGPSIIAFAAENELSISRAMTAAFQEKGIAAKALVLDFDREGAVVLDRRQAW